MGLTGLIGLKAGLTGLLGLTGLMGLTGGEKGPLEEDDYDQEFQKFNDTIINMFLKDPEMRPDTRRFACPARFNKVNQKHY